MNTQFLKKQILTTETHSVWVGKKKKCDGGCYQLQWL